MTKWHLVLGGFIFWRVVLFGMSAVASRFLPYAPTFPYSDILLIPSGYPAWIYSWANFDGVHYLTIAAQGYVGVGLVQAFFPFFPWLLLHTCFLLTQSLTVTLGIGLVATTGAALCLAVLWVLFLKQAIGERYQYTGSLLLWTFPTAFFFGALYTESLFLCFVLLAFLFARRGQWWMVAVATMLATSTRVVGIFLVPALLVEWWIQQGQKKTWRMYVGKWWQVGLIASGSLGLLAYMLFLWRTFGDPLYFAHVQTAFATGRQAGVTLYPQVIWRALKIVATVRPFDLHYLVYLEELVVALLGLWAILWTGWKVRWSYAVFSLGAFLLPITTGTLSSLTRYVLVCPAVFLALTLWLHHRPKIMVGWVLGAGVLLVIHTMMFIQGWWVA